MAGKPRRNSVTDEQIIAAYRQNLSSYKVAAILGIGATTVERVLTKHAEPRPGLAVYRRKITKFLGQENLIREAYESGLTYEQLRLKFGQASDYAFKHALKRAGAMLRADPAPLIKDGELDRIREMNAAGYGQVRISLALGRSQSFVSRVMRKHKIAPNNRSGADHGMWKGGRFIDSHGYVRIMIGDDPLVAQMKMHDGYVLEHRAIMARKLGRALLRSETVHHINGDRRDNRPENLELRQGKHGKGIVLCCLDCGSRNIGSAKIEP